MSIKLNDTFGANLKWNNSTKWTISFSELNLMRTIGSETAVVGWLAPDKAKKVNEKNSLLLFWKKGGVSNKGRNMLSVFINSKEKVIIEKNSSKISLVCYLLVLGAHKAGKVRHANSH